MVAVDGQALPASFGGIQNFVVYSTGDLLLQADGRFGYGIRTNHGGGISRGTYAPTSGGYGFQHTGDSQVFDGAVRGDTVHLTILSRTFSFVEARSWSRPPVDGGRYVLKSVNGNGPPFILQEIVDERGRWTYEVAFDTLRFFDGTFMQQHRAEEWGSELADGSPPTTASEEWETQGGYGMSGTTLTLRIYGWASAGTLLVDDLALEGDALVRRRTQNGVTTVERYERIP